MRNGKENKNRNEIGVRRRDGGMKGKNLGRGGCPWSTKIEKGTEERKGKGRRGKEVGGRGQRR